MENTDSLTSKHDEFLERLSETEDIVSCIDRICVEFEIDFVTYHLAFHEGKAIDTPYVKTNYPADWVRQYLIMNYLEIDPVVESGFDRALPCLWTELDWSKPEVADFVADAVKHGVGGSGYLIPLTDRRRRRAMVNFACVTDPVSWERRVADLAPTFFECAAILHRKAIIDLYGQEDVRPALTPRELQCLSWVAQGKDAGAIAIILGISEHTVRDYCKSAKHKLGCATLFQAIHKATMLRLIQVDIADRP